MNQNNKEAIQSAFDSLYSNKTVRIVLYTGLALVALYGLGKVFSVMAGTIRSFRDFRSAASGS